MDKVLYWENEQNACGILFGAELFEDLSEEYPDIQVTINSFTVFGIVLNGMAGV